jgi:Holliday junction DNA helicase RuvA
LIGSVRGTIVARASDHVVVDVGGIGYRVFVPRPPSADDVLLHTHQVVREDAHLLFGFESREELALFDLLISVSGVGPKGALAVLATARPGEIAAAIAAGDAASLARAPGVGKKTAERLIVDLRGKVAGLSAAAGGPGPLPADEAAAALVSLGFTASEAAAALRDSPPAASASTEERLAAALRAAGRR